MSKIHEAQEILGSVGKLRNFMSVNQRSVLLSLLRGEEGDAIADLVINAAKAVEATPMTYQTKGVETESKCLCLHYFMGGADAWIVERDVGDMPTGNGTGKQLQAYGKITLFGGGWKEAEWGYISIDEMITLGFELDLHWVPKTVGEMK